MGISSGEPEKWRGDKFGNKLDFRNLAEYGSR